MHTSIAYRIKNPHFSMHSQHLEVKTDHASSIEDWADERGIPNHICFKIYQISFHSS